MALKSLKKQRRIQVIALAAVALIAATGVIGYGMRDGINFFRSPSQILAEPPSANETFRIGGMVVEGSIQADEAQKFFFDVTDGGATVRVHYIGNDPKPDLFTEGQGTVATGTYQNGVFRATEILAKHDETYMPREVQDALRENGYPGLPES